jgi:glutamate dehydrogenase/leucine dehydrogenase
LFHEAGFQVVAIGDIKNAVYNENGIDVPALVEHVAKTGFVEGFAGTTGLSNGDLLELPCDILVPAAVQSVLNAENADRVKAKLIMEAANGPTTPEAEEILQAKGIKIVPDVLTNCGSAIVCSFERTQGLTDDYWSADKVKAKLEERIVEAYKATRAASEQHNTSMRNGAWINALTKLQNSMKARGWI